MNTINPHTHHPGPGDGPGQSQPVRESGPAPQGPEIPSAERATEGSAPDRPEALVGPGGQGVPDAVEADHIRRRQDLGPAEGRPARGVEWVRPTDLMARHSAVVAGRGIDFEAALARRVRGPLVAPARRLGSRVAHLPPMSAFGRGHQPHQVSRDAVGYN
ncbi:hypothetical protein M3B43_10190 [Nesterenkonia massiliensis]|uniref:Uncharacterized protein n=1 Tax=Nesterenkonia massiliensis TaxID=1232429 RepID=A0ABT2HSI4_9MICC|nr:hypothetical protein [Nesterenkonia massiliensis]MCT1607679.1 hypothetical protein [Nesterenkonia massiliensis]